MRRHSAAEFYACGHCGQLYHRGSVYPGRGRDLGEHPEHEYAPCGHSQTWHGRRPVEVEPEPPTGLEFFEPDREPAEPDYGGAFDGFTVTSDADPGL
jgi:hypothetical protein